MFRALTLFRLQGSAHLDADFDEVLAPLTFAPCLPTQPLSAGFAPPRGEANGALCERITSGGISHAILKVMFESRLLPSSVVRDRVDELAEQVEQESGRKPGAKRRRELRDEAMLDLLPKAFTRQSATMVWICPKLGLIGIDTTSQSRADAVMTLLVKAIPDLAVSVLQTQESPATCMRAWLADGVAATGFGIGRGVTLQATDIAGAGVKYTKHGLEGEDVQLHLKEGKRVKQLALNWRDRLEFVLLESLRIRSLKLDVGVSLNDSDPQVDAFDAEMAITTGELGRFVPELLEGLGGVVDAFGAAPAERQEQDKLAA